MFSTTIGPSFFSHLPTMPPLNQTKPHKSYTELVSILESRGMIINDHSRAERKISQVGYYRLTGFSYPCRIIARDPMSRKVLINSQTGHPLRLDQFMPDTSFDDIFSLYLFDKKLRLLLIDAIERIEVNIRSIIAHEMGYHDPLAYKDPQYINPKKTQTWFDKKQAKYRNTYNDWCNRHADQISRSNAECIEWHRQNKSQIPFWVAIEAWDFGTMSQYYSLLKKRYQNRICSRLQINNAKTLEVWLRSINTLRNRCAHHSRVWNKTESNPLPTLPIPYFNKLDFSSNSRHRVAGYIAILWFLIKQIGPSSNWIHSVAELVENEKPTMPGCPNTAMGFPHLTGFPRSLFDI